MHRQIPQYWTTAIGDYASEWQTYSCLDCPRTIPRIAVTSRTVRALGVTPFLICRVSYLLLGYLAKLGPHMILIFRPAYSDEVIGHDDNQTHMCTAIIGKYKGAYRPILKSPTVWLRSLSVHVRTKQCPIPYGRQPRVGLHNMTPRVLAGVFPPIPERGPKEVVVCQI